MDSRGCGVGSLGLDTGFLVGSVDVVIGISGCSYIPELVLLSLAANPSRRGPLVTPVFLFLFFGITSSGSSYGLDLQCEMYICLYVCAYGCFELELVYWRVYLPSSCLSTLAGLGNYG